MIKSRAVITITLGAVLALSALVLSQWRSYHDFSGRCLDCHVTEPRPGDEPRAFSKNITRMCVDCHKAELELSHPVDVRPSMQVPKALPVDWKGEVTCITCHAAHQSGHGPFRLRFPASGEGFCTLCHGDMESEMHKISLGAAHLAGSTSRKYVPMEINEVLDDLSIRCLACHDALTAKDSIVENMALQRDFFHNDNTIGLSHPIGVSYIKAKRMYRGAYRAVSDLPKEIKLFSGTVGCGSCHNPYSKQHSELVMSNEGSALCLGCHVK